MELFIGLIIAVFAFLLIYFNWGSKDLDINKDGKIDVEDAKVAVENVVEGVTKKTRRSAKPKAPTISKTAGTRGRKPRKA
jgi:hypothetical protein